MSIPRRIVSLAGLSGQFAVADDGTVWHWSGADWAPWGRTSLPPRELPLDFYGQGIIDNDPPKIIPNPTPTPDPPARRGPGRPRKVQP